MHGISDAPPRFDGSLSLRKWCSDSLLSSMELHIHPKCDVQVYTKVHLRNVLEKTLEGLRNKGLTNETYVVGKKIFFPMKPKCIFKYNLEEIIMVNFSDNFLQFYHHSFRNNFIPGYNTLPDLFPVSSYSIKTRQNHILQLQICRHWNVKSLISESIPSLHLGTPQKLEDFQLPCTSLRLHSSL